MSTSSRGIEHEFDSHGHRVFLAPGLQSQIHAWISDIRCGQPETITRDLRECDATLGIENEVNSHGSLQQLAPGEPAVDIWMVTCVACESNALLFDRILTNWPPGTRILNEIWLKTECCPDYDLHVKFVVVEILGAKIEDERQDYEFTCCPADGEDPQPPICPEYTPSDPLSGAGLAFVPPGEEITYPVSVEFNSHGDLQSIGPVPYAPGIFNPIVSAGCSSEPCELDQVEPDATSQWKVTAQSRKLTAPAVVVVCKEQSGIAPCCTCCDDDAGSSASSSSSSSSSSSFGCCEPSDDLCVVIELSNSGSVCCTRTLTISRSGDIWSGTINDPCWGGDMLVEFFCKGSNSWELSLDVAGDVCLFEENEYSCDPCFEWRLGGIDKTPGTCIVIDGCGVGGVGNCAAGADAVHITIFETGGGNGCPACPADAGACP